MLSWRWTKEEYDDLIQRIESLRSTVIGLQTKLNTISQQETQMAVDVSALTAEVTRNSSVTASVVQLVNNLAEQIANFPPSDDPVTQAALDALRNTLVSNDDTIAAAVTANTPVPPP